MYQKETEYESAFAAIVNNFPPYILRSFLVQISIEGAQGHAIMQTHYRQLADDIPGNDSNLPAAKLLQKIHAAFQNQGKNACDYGFPDAPVIDDPLHGIFNVANQNQKWTDMAKGLSAEQLKIVAFCLTAMTTHLDKQNLYSLTRQRATVKHILPVQSLLVFEVMDTPFAARQQRHWHQFFTREVEQHTAPMAYR